MQPIIGFTLSAFGIIALVVALLAVRGTGERLRARLFLISIGAALLFFGLDLTGIIPNSSELLLFLGAVVCGELAILSFMYWLFPQQTARFINLRNLETPTM